MRVDMWWLESIQGWEDEFLGAWVKIESWVCLFLFCFVFFLLCEKRNMTEERGEKERRGEWWDNGSLLTDQGRGGEEEEGVGEEKLDSPDRGCLKWNCSPRAVFYLYTDSHRRVTHHTENKMSSEGWFLPSEPKAGICAPQLFCDRK